ncbi:capsular polysaccharide export protein, LipB/KpsS family [Psychrobacter sp. AOP22-C1-22]|uniref:capsular polysaccharide export protein, LipB/KpsS family n=1 Tax=unclassified Psychrobacter TaxID=196806 RepID=UPI001787C3C1|nr:capsular polysaccharide biosynthesis protein [Psychrobacter sp. FME6]MBE0405680.1 capsular polysaccharide biosynthesis protein [Psychrobacter sp. FME6]
MKFEAYIKPLLSGYYKHYRQPKQRLALVVGMQPWRDMVADWVFEASHIQTQRHFDQHYFDKWLKPFIQRINPVIYIWGYKAPPFFIDYIREQGLDIFFLEDGFIRSGPDDESGAPPLSIVIDSQAPYFDTSRPNDLTDLIANFDFEQDGYDETLAQEMLDYYVARRVSKYNHQPYVDVVPIYGIKNKKRILVLGQVPHDDSLKYGGGIGITLLDVVNRAINENPNAQIIVKPHPMTLNDSSIVNTLTELDCLILTQSIHLVDALETIDHVYTITSLGGFEALLRGKKVTVLGRPFYEAICEREDNKCQYFLICYLYSQYNHCVISA